jgi:threonine/homoserine/homoserine lactone efflux protein
MAGAAVTFGATLFAVALGIGVAAPDGPVLRGLQVAGGLLLIWLSIEGLRSGGRVGASDERRSLPPAVRGALAVLVNPGAWLFLGAVASPTFADASRHAGTAGAVAVTVTLIAGLAVGDATVVLLGGLGLRPRGERVRNAVHRALALVLAALGTMLVVKGVVA